MTMKFNVTSISARYSQANLIVERVHETIGSIMILLYLVFHRLQNSMFIYTQYM